MDEKRDHIPLTGIFIATALVAWIVTIWTTTAVDTLGIVITASVSAFIGTLLTPYGLRVGVALGTAALIVSCYCVRPELGTLEIIPILWLRA
jgi:hypothetical protein